MGQILIRNIDDAVIESFKTRARVAGTSLEHYLRGFLAGHATMSQAERISFARSIRDCVTSDTTPMTKDEIREGLE